MNYLLEERRNALAAEYVLGTLRGGARRRYQQLMMQHQLVRETTWVWEQYINVLGHKLKPIEPSDKVWQTVAAQLGFSEQNTGKSSAGPDNVVEFKSATTRIWKSVAGLAAAAAIVLAVILIQVQQPDLTPTQFAVVQSEQAQALWLIEVGDGQIRVKATEKLAQQANNDYELWFVAADGRAPVSLGLLPQSGELTLPKSELFGAVDLAALAVSLEPSGGSPTGSPTTVLYTTELVTL